MTAPGFMAVDGRLIRISAIDLMEPVGPSVDGPEGTRIVLRQGTVVLTATPMADLEGALA